MAEQLTLNQRVEGSSPSRLTTHSECVEDVVLAAQTVPGSVVAICDFGNNTGDVVFIDAESEAEAKCSAGGSTGSTRVVGVLHLP